MKTISRDGLSLDAKIVSDGRRYFLICSVEECQPWCEGSYSDIVEALKGMTAFQLSAKMYPPRD